MTPLQNQQSQDKSQRGRFQRDTLQNSASSAMPLLILFVLWLLLASGMIFMQREAIALLYFVDNDDAMRLVQVRDWLYGQSWFDLHQYRLNPPEAVLMHWQRLVDVPVAAFIAGLEPFVGSLHAQQSAVALVPMLLLLAIAAFVQRTAICLGGSAAALPSALLCLTCIPVLLQIFPTRIDHHGWQILCLAGMVYGLCHNTLRGFACAGFFAGLAVAVGAEGVPFAALTCLLVTAYFLVLPVVQKRKTQIFALAFTGSVVAIFVGTTPFAYWAIPYCDAIARGPVIGALGFGLTLLAATQISHKKTACISVVAGFGLTLGLVLGLAPECRTSFGGLGDIDPMLKTLWLARVVEAQSVLADIKTDPFDSFLFLTTPLLAFALLGRTFWTLAHAKPRTPQSLAALWPWLVIAVHMLLALAMTLYMVRSAGLLNMLAALVCSLKIAQLRSLPNTGSALPGLSWLGLSWLGLSGFTPLALATTASQSVARPNPVEETAQATLKADTKACRSHGAFKRLASLPPGLVLAPIESGAPLLVYTRHSVLAAPYHRNNAGNGFTYQLLLGAAPKAPALLQKRGVDYIVLCKNSAEARFLAIRAAEQYRTPNSLVQALLDEKPPAGIRLVEGDAPLLLYALE